MRTHTLTALLLLSAACAAPGLDIVPEPTDFAVVSIQLNG